MSEDNNPAPTPAPDLQGSIPPSEFLGFEI